MRSNPLVAALFGFHIIEEKAKALIDEDISLLWLWDEELKISPADAAVEFNNSKMLEYMAGAIGKQPKEKHEQMFRQTFECPDDKGTLPVHTAAWYGYLSCLEFLVKNCPSGSKILECQNRIGNSALHFAAIAGEIETFKWILEKSSDPLRLLMLKSQHQLAPLEAAPENARVDLTKVVREFGFARELEMLNVSENCGALVSLICGIMRQQIALSE